LQQLTQLQVTIEQMTEKIVAEPIILDNIQAQQTTVKTQTTPPPSVTEETSKNTDYGDWADE
jgi:hypothetical protein